MSAAVAAAASAAISGYNNSSSSSSNHSDELLTSQRMQVSITPTLSSGANVLEFLRYLDQFGKTKVHSENCAYYGNSHPPGPCPCPLKQAWGSLDALIGRLRAAFEENGGSSEMNPFGARAVRLYLREVRDAQAKARGIGYEKKKRKKLNQNQQNGSMIMVDQEHDVVHSSGWFRGDWR
ncbi:hypothetical protein P8452_33455 [Trifolium repens]|nr:hypothetical protein P8452_33455 [Trifolium repens]